RPGHRDDRIGGFDGGALGPAGHRVTAAELFPFPRPPRLQRVGGDNVRDVVEERGDEPAEVGVPRVAVYDVNVGKCGGHREVDRQGPERGVRLEQLRRRNVPDRAVARRTPGVDTKVDEPAQLAAEEIDVDAGTTVDIGRVLPAEEPDLHGVSPALRAAVTTARASSCSWVRWSGPRKDSA